MGRKKWREKMIILAIVFAALLVAGGLIGAAVIYSKSNTRPLAPQPTTVHRLPSSQPARVPIAAALQQIAAAHAAPPTPAPNPAPKAEPKAKPVTRTRVSRDGEKGGISPTTPVWVLQRAVVVKDDDGIGEGEWLVHELPYGQLGRMRNKPEFFWTKQAAEGESSKRNVWDERQQRAKVASVAEPRKELTEAEKQEIAAKREENEASFKSLVEAFKVEVEKRRAERVLPLAELQNAESVHPEPVAVLVGRVHGRYQSLPVDRKQFLAHGKARKPQAQGWEYPFRSFQGDNAKEEADSYAGEMNSRAQGGGGGGGGGRRDDSRDIKRAVAADDGHQKAAGKRRKGRNNKFRPNRDSGPAVEVPPFIPTAEEVKVLETYVVAVVNKNDKVFGASAEVAEAATTKLADLLPEEAVLAALSQGDKGNSPEAAAN